MTTPRAVADDEIESRLSMVVLVLFVLYVVIFISDRLVPAAYASLAFLVCRLVILTTGVLFARRHWRFAFALLLVVTVLGPVYDGGGHTPQFTWRAMRRFRRIPERCLMESSHSFFLQAICIS
jgi:hypothetical protein